MEKFSAVVLAIAPASPYSAASLRRVFAFRCLVDRAGYEVRYDSDLDYFVADSVPVDFAFAAKRWLESQNYENGFEFPMVTNTCSGTLEDSSDISLHVEKNEVREVSTQHSAMRLTQGKWCLIDTASLPLVTGHIWHAELQHGTWYGATNLTMPDGTRRNVRMHELLLECPRGMMRDHRNGNGLDNRIENLRVTGPRGNAQNRHHRLAKTGRVGVCRVGNRYASRAYINGRHVSLGRFDTPEEAEAAYRQATANAEMRKIA